MRISDWSSDVCSSDLSMPGRHNRSIDGRAAESAARSIVGEKREARRPTMLKKLKIMSLAGAAIAMGAAAMVPATPAAAQSRHHQYRGHDYDRGHNYRNYDRRDYRRQDRKSTRLNSSH